MRRAVHATLIWLTLLGRCVPLFHVIYHRCRIYVNDGFANLLRTVTGTDCAVSLSRHCCANRHAAVAAIDRRLSTVSSYWMLRWVYVRFDRRPFHCRPRARKTVGQHLILKCYRNLYKKIYYDWLPLHATWWGKKVTLNICIYQLNIRTTVRAHSKFRRKKM